MLRAIIWKRDADVRSGRDMSKVKLQEMLIRRPGLVKPIFRLEKIGTKLAGSIISATFKGKSDR
jgi:hypothetical protein